MKDDKTLEHFATFFRDRMARAVMLDQMAHIGGRQCEHVCEAIEWVEAAKSGLTKEQTAAFEKICPRPRDAVEGFYAELAKAARR